MSPIAAAVLALVSPLRWFPAGDGAAAPLRPERLSPHLLRDLGLADGRDGGGMRDSTRR